jgi:ketosteroid isomerase-like protein
VQSEVRSLYVEPTQQPVTGNEPLGDRHEPLQALAEFYKAFNSRDLVLMQQNWDPSPEAAMDNPLGGIKRGWDQIRQVYEGIFTGKARVQVEFYDYSLHVNGDIFYVVGRERGTFSAAGQTLPVAIRTSRVFRRTTEGRWRQIHHHGSIEDPRVLQSYLDLVR